MILLASIFLYLTIGVLAASAAPNPVVWLALLLLWPVFLVRMLRRR